MNHVTLDLSVLSSLLGGDGPVEVRDPAGQVVGLFAPVRPDIRPLSRDEVTRLFDFEEAKRVAREQRGQGRPLSEIIQRLQSAEPET